MGRSEQIIWAAGFIDGEGSVIIAKGNGGRQPWLVLSAAQNSIEPLLILQELWGGSITFCRARKETHSDHHLWCAKARKAQRALIEMRPFLIVKRRQADLAFDFMRLFGRRGGGQHVPEWNLKTREAIRQAMHHLNTSRSVSQKQVEKAVQGKGSRQLRLVS